MKKWNWLLAAGMVLLMTSAVYADVIVGIDAWTGDLYQVNETTGVCTLLTTTGLPFDDPFVYGACTSGSPDLIYATDNGAAGTLYTVDPSDGSTTAVGTYNGDTTNILELACDASGGVLYGTDYAALYTVDSTTAATAKVGDFTVAGMMAMTYVPGAGLYGVDNNPGTLYEINTSTTALSAVGPTGAAAQATIDLAYDTVTATLIGSVNIPDQRICDVNIATGQATLLNNTGVPNMLGLAVLRSASAPTVIPEPAGLGLIGMAMIAARRKRH